MATYQVAYASALDTTVAPTDTLFTTANDVWIDWVGQTYATNTTTATSSTTVRQDSTGIWRLWVSDGWTQHQLNIVLVPEETEGERTAREAQQAAERELRRVAEEKRQKEQKEAQKRAEALLLSLLAEDQRAQWKEKKYVDVLAESNKKYRVFNKWTGNVLELNDKGKGVATYCIHPSQSMPSEDNMAAQILMLQFQEAEFLRIANRSAVWQ